jgi:glycosyltransferase involved in cell wall biosynthesis
MFSHDTELSLLAVVDLVNSAPECGGRERIPDATALREFVERHHISAVTARDLADVESIHGVRRRLRGVFGLDDPAAAAERVNALLADPSRAASMGRAGRERAVHEFAWPAIAEQTAALYRKTQRGTVPFNDPRP